MIESLDKIIKRIAKFFATKPLSRVRNMRARFRMRITMRANCNGERASARMCALCAGAKNEKMLCFCHFFSAIFADVKNMQYFCTEFEN